MKRFIVPALISLGCASIVFAAEEKAAAAPKPAATIVSTDSAGHSQITAKVFGDFDQGPIPKFRAVATYPSQLAAAHVRGKAVVLFTLLENGEIKDAHGMGTDKAFTAAATDAARRSKFMPARKGGHPIACKLELIYDFPGPMVSGGESP